MVPDGDRLAQTSTTLHKQSIKRACKLAEYQVQSRRRPDSTQRDFVLSAYPVPTQRDKKPTPNISAYFSALFSGA
jgi:hypothetical protein